MRFAVLACLILASSASNPSVRAEDGLLTVGSTAPQLSIQHWFPLADGSTKPVQSFQRGKVYVVEFWATWCGPCLQGMPHLAQLQRDYMDKGVQVIGVSSEDLQTVEQFLGREVPRAASSGASSDAQTEDSAKKSAQPQTYAQLTSAYSLACDPDASTEKAYMQAAFQSSIPNAFIVGKDGKIEWIGHPGAMDDVLRQVVAGAWNRAEFGKKFLAGQQAEVAKVELSSALQQRDFVKAVALIDKRLAQSDQPQEQLELRLTKIQIALAEKDLKGATVRLQETFAATKGRVDMVDLICWHIYEQAEQRRTDISPLVQVAYAEGEKALQSAKGESLASLLDTVGHLAYKAGDKAKAIELVTRAVELAEGENKEFSKQFLEQLKEEK